jgi:mediator of RNA polymerase II transcription subunit 12
MVSEKISLLRAHAQQPSTTSVQSDQASLRKYMTIVDCTSTAGPDDTVSDCGSAINERLRAIADLMVTFNTTVSSAGDNAENTLTSAEACHWYACTLNLPFVHLTDYCSIDALLRLAVIHRNSTNATKLNCGEQLSMLRTLCALITEPQLEGFSSIGDFLFDVAAYMSDDVPDDIRTHFLKSDIQRHSDDARISFLFGPLQATDSWVGLVTTNHTMHPPGSASRPNTPPARFGPGQQHQGSIRGQQRPPAPQRPASPMPNPPKSFNAPVPFPLRQWELLPEQGNNSSGNDTSISLALFGARKVDNHHI